MLVVSEKIKREDLFQEILETMREWPERDQRIFSQAHYHGQSVEKISASLNLNVGEVRTVLQNCTRKLYTKLSKFRRDEYGRSTIDIIQAAASITCKSVPGGCNF